jgi:hypothetical protein
MVESTAWRHYRLIEVRRCVASDARLDEEKQYAA